MESHKHVSDPVQLTHLAAPCLFHPDVKLLFCQLHPNPPHGLLHVIGLEERFVHGECVVQPRAVFLIENILSIAQQLVARAHKNAPLVYDPLMSICRTMPTWTMHPEPRSTTTVLYVTPLRKPTIRVYKGPTAVIVTNYAERFTMRATFSS